MVHFIFHRCPTSLYVGIDLLVHFTGERKSIKEFFPSINERVYKKPRKKMIDDFPSQEYTDPRCMRLIKERDKDANAPYVKDFHDELRKDIKIRNYIIVS